MVEGTTDKEIEVSNLNLSKKYLAGGLETPITIVNSICRFGNQLFHFTFLLYLRKFFHEKRNCFILFYNRDESEILQVFPQLKPFVISNSVVSELLDDEENSVWCIREPKVSCYQEIWDSISEIDIYVGFWQCWQYVSTVEDQLRSLLKFDEGLLNQKSIACLEKINHSFSVSLHIRRGDYEEQFNNRLSFGRICTAMYYERAIKYLVEKFPDCNITFFVFSDDIDWAKKSNILFAQKSVYVDWNYGVDAWQDMCLMSNCQHHIIANSSFSWWGAWLNASSSKVVVAPNIWYNDIASPDILPLDWIKIEVEPLVSKVDFEGLTVVIPVDVKDKVHLRNLKYIDSYFTLYTNITVLIICSEKQSLFDRFVINPVFQIIEIRDSYSYTKYINQSINFVRTKHLAIWNIYSLISPLQMEEAWLLAREDDSRVVYPYLSDTFVTTKKQLKAYEQLKDFRTIFDHQNVSTSGQLKLEGLVAIMHKDVFLNLGGENESIRSIKYSAFELSKRIEREGVITITVLGELYLLHKEILNDRIGFSNDTLFL